MNIRLVLLTMVILVTSLGLAGDALADISNAAVLFLRIAPGSRAAGMGEAYVALADDATATHWNPAGLGSYPLADTWIEAGIPDAYQPLKGFAPLSTGGTRNYLDYDIWAITPQGLIRYNNKRWNTQEVFGTKTSQTLEDIVHSYFRNADEGRFQGVVERVALLNNHGAYSSLETLRDSILQAVPESYDARASVVEYLDSLLAGYRGCRVNWERVAEARDHLKNGLKDSTLNDTECDRLSVALERARSRYLPEELFVPYSALFQSEPTSIASTGDVLLVGSADGLVKFNGRFWEAVATDEGKPVTGVTCLYLVGGAILVGTVDGVGAFRGQTVSPLTSGEGGLPAGAIDAIGGSSMVDLYTVVGGNLYRFDGRRWSDRTSYTVAVDDSLDKIAARFSLYGTPADRQRFIDRFTTTPAPAAIVAVTDSAQDTTLAVPVAVDSAATPQETPAVVDAGVNTSLQPGAAINVPLAASIKGRVTSIFVDPQKRIWLGTDYGVFCFTDGRWTAPGYEDHVVAADESLETLVLQRTNINEDERPAYRALVTDLNDLGDTALTVGATVRLYKRGTALPVNSIGGDGRIVYFATSKGLIEYDGRNWSRTSLRGLTSDNIVGVGILGSESWIASNERLVIKGRGHSEFSFMYVKWLPELADDLYYSFASFVSPKEGWGTFGLSFTLISYGTFSRTNEVGTELGTFDSYDFAGAISFGTSLTNKIKGGVTLKLIRSQLSDQGAGSEKGSGSSTGFAIDLGLLGHMTDRFSWGLALTNLGPKMTYIDAAQSDDLPRNLAIGVAYKLLRSEYTSLIATVEANKLMVGLDDKSSDELKEMIFNGGIEFMYANLFAARAGYIYDQEGEVKTPTLGFGLSPFNWGSLDFAYIPSQKESFSLANTLRITFRLVF